MTESNPPGARGGPTVLRMILGRQLRKLREKAGLSLAEAAEKIYMTEWTVRRMEDATGGLKPIKVKGLLMAYGVTDVREIDAFLALVREASKPGWWHNYADVLPNWFRESVGFEEAADLIRAYEPQCVPGLLQTEGYARALIMIGFPDAIPDETERRVALRMARQSLLVRPDSPHLWAVLDESVLRRPVGGRDVMRGQLTRLPAAALGPGGWRKPWSGPNGGSCLEAKVLPGGKVALRQSADPAGPALILEPHEIEAFIQGAKHGKADYLLPPNPTPSAT
jgi:hypothetical protein